LIALAALLLGWQTAHWSGISEFVLPSPWSVASAFVRNWKILVVNVLVTGGEALAGFALGGFCAFLVACGSAHSKHLRATAYPYAVAMKVTPIIVLSPLLVFYLGNGIPSKIAMAAISSFFPVFVSTLDGLTRVDAFAVDLFRSLSATKWQTFRKLRLPASLPAFFAGLKIAGPVSFVGAITGEFVGAQFGIGHVITLSLYNIDIDIVFAAIGVTTATGFVFFLSIVFIEKTVVFWK
jgi:NitT/TauT family transport system permease protein